LDKIAKRAHKLAARQIQQPIVDAIVQQPTGPVDCACVIYGSAYDWTYVERLYNMLNRHITVGIRLHVYTEADRTVPEPMIKHELTEWPLVQSRRAWWYKMQLFNPVHHAGPLLYFDLDTVIVRNIDWIWQSPVTYFWAVRDFKYLWRTNHVGLNSSIMWWDTRHYRHIWDTFLQQDLAIMMKKYHGDQDYISAVIPQNQRRFFDQNQVQSWRWQCLDGGYNFAKRRHQTAGSGTVLSDRTSVMIFHGNPKPSTITDPVVIAHWR
jgi:hypothetical protein